MRWSTLRLSKRNAFPLLLIASLLLALSPQRWYTGIRGLLQPVAWMQAGASGLTRLASDAVSASTEDRPTRQELARLVNERDGLLREALHLQTEIASLRRRLEETTRLRDAIGDPAARLVVADIVGGDTSPLRASLFVSCGSGGDGIVRAGDWVAAGAPLDEQASLTGAERLSRQWLIGRVEAVDLLQTRVMLATDPSFGPVRAWVSRKLEDGTRQLADRDCLLFGAGGGRMILRNAIENYLEEGYEYVHVAISEELPAPIAIGRLISARRLDESALHYNLEVEPLGDVRTIGKVYVISAGTP